MEIRKGGSSQEQRKGAQLKTDEMMLEGRKKVKMKAVLDTLRVYEKE